MASSSVAAALGAVDHPDPVLGQRRAHVLLPLERLPPAEIARSLEDPLGRLPGRQAVGPAGVDTGVDLVVQAGHAHHEELVEVGRVDGEELDSLE